MHIPTSCGGKLGADSKCAFVLREGPEKKSIGMNPGKFVWLHMSASHLRIGIAPNEPGLRLIKGVQRKDCQNRRVLRIL